ncbi:bifunctional adenosylcobinamide kinase/adenosylcobinamide-phosphate guanylyltransferase [Pleurocapsales cyanobacterium LEGE 06147]|nr:bifunctional adenosylcobinamide kinase/adenosylcobinamide-phosphate guanylyltransferase [Pleurocapsales cyanobacterium LEGE 06147]
MNSIQTNSKQITLVTGAARSGKSEWAEMLAGQTGKAIIYIATALVDPSDREWQARIARHQQRRPSHWQTLSLPTEIAPTITKALASHCLLIDSLGTWVANLLDLEESLWQKTTDNLITSLELTAADVILVGEETGWGVVPAYESGRIFRDRLGYLLRQIGSRADAVYLVAGGHVLDLKALGQPLRNSEI